jgi:hypothetical protein
MWTPSREDLCVELAGEIGDEDTTLVERAEVKADRLEDLSTRRAQDGDRAQNAVHAIADGIPFGQPILVGHHSERHARKDAEKIEKGMRRAVEMWKAAEYWQSRAKGAIRLAKYKERPDVRARRIKGLEASKRKEEKSQQEAEMWLKLWTACSQEQDKKLQAQVALRIAGMCHLNLARKEGDKEGHPHTPSAYDALTGSFPSLYAPRTLDEVFTAALAAYPRRIEHTQRWIDHYTNRVAYERARDGAIRPLHFPATPQDVSLPVPPASPPAPHPCFSGAEAPHRGQNPARFSTVEAAGLPFRGLANNHLPTPHLAAFHAARCAPGTPPAPELALSRLVISLRLSCEV